MMSFLSDPMFTEDLIQQTNEVKTVALLLPGLGLVVQSVVT